MAVSGGHLKVARDQRHKSMGISFSPAGPARMDACASARSVGCSRIVHDMLDLYAEAPSYGRPLLRQQLRRAARADLSRLHHARLPTATADPQGFAAVIGDRKREAEELHGSG